MATGTQTLFLYMPQIVTIDMCIWLIYIIDDFIKYLNMIWIMIDNNPFNILIHFRHATDYLWLYFKRLYYIPGND